jgi:beta-galactosidase
MLDLDPSRPVQYEGGSRAGSSFMQIGDGTSEVSDVICPMYHPPAHLLAHVSADRRRPLVLCEYAHAMGNSSGNLHEYFAAFEQHERLQGGCVLLCLKRREREQRNNKTKRVYTV